MKILVVDDNDDFRFLVVNFLIGLDHDISTAKDGHEAYQYFLKEHKNIALIITDINMPRMSGLDLIKQVRSHDPVGIKIIAMSGGTSSVDVLSFAAELGADNTFGKPFDIGHFRKAVKGLICK